MSSFCTHILSAKKKKKKKTNQHICVSPGVNFNESLTNDVVSFEQVGPEILIKWNLLKTRLVTVLAVSLFL